MISNYQLLTSLHALLYSKKSYLDYLEENGGWWFMIDYAEHFIGYSSTINKPLESKYNFSLLPVIKSSHNDDVLCLYENKYIMIHSHCDLGYEFRGEFFTPEEVWKKVIKPDIEDYYGIKIDE